MTNNLSTAELNSFIDEISAFTGERAHAAGKTLAANYVDRFISHGDELSDAEMCAAEMLTVTSREIVAAVRNGSLWPSTRVAFAAHVLAFALLDLGDSVDVGQELVREQLVAVHSMMTDYIIALNTKLGGAS